MTTKERILQRIEERLKPTKVVHTIDGKWMIFKSNEKIKLA